LQETVSFWKENGKRTARRFSRNNRGRSRDRISIAKLRESFALISERVDIRAGRVSRAPHFASINFQSTTCTSVVLRIANLPGRCIYFREGEIAKPRAGETFLISRDHPESRGSISGPSITAAAAAAEVFQFLDKLVPI